MTSDTKLLEEKIRKWGTWLPTPDTYSTRKCIHRVRYLQPEILKREETKAKAEVIGDKASLLFRTIFKEHMEQNLDALEYTADMAVEDFRLMLKDVTDNTNNFPSKKSFHDVLIYIPSYLPEHIDQQFATIFEEERKKFLEVEEDEAPLDSEPYETLGQPEGSTVPLAIHLQQMRMQQAPPSRIRQEDVSMGLL